MKPSRHSPEQIVRKLREGDRSLDGGKNLAEVSRHLKVAESSWDCRRTQYGSIKHGRARFHELEAI